MDLQLFLDYSDTYAPATILFLFAYYGFKRWPPQTAVLYFYVYVATLVFGLSNYLANQSINNLFLYHFFILAEVFFAGWLVTSFINNAKKKRIIWTSVLIFCLFSIINTIFFESIHDFNRRSIYVGCIVEMFICFFYYLHLIDEEQPVPVKHNLSFFVVTGFFVYASICAIVFYFYPVVNDEQSYEKDLLWLIQDFALILKYILISSGLLWYTKTQQLN